MDKSFIKKLFILYIVVIAVFIVIKPHWGLAYLIGRVEGIYQLRTAGIWNLNLRPFMFTEPAHVSRLNIIAFVPLGIFLNILGYKFLKTLLISALIVFCIELVQFLFCLGAADIDDFILNMLGMVMGYMICRLIRWFL